MPARGFGQRIGCRPGDRFGIVEPRVVFSLARIQSVEQLLQADDLRPAACGIRNESQRFLDVRALVPPASHLDDAHMDDTRRRFDGGHHAVVPIGGRCPKPP
jgi:hypothetical protein